MSRENRLSLSPHGLADSEIDAPWDLAPCALPSALPSAQPCRPIRRKFFPKCACLQLKDVRL
jgi:hypothetical protein